jgi:hypothetical protein
VAVAGAVVLAIPDMLSEQVEDVDFSIVRFGFSWFVESLLSAEALK